MKDTYKEALGKAKSENKMVLVSFTGYACSNCKWMKTNMFPRQAVRSELDNYVLVELYTDGTDAASLENQKLQETKFKTVAIPHYAILTADEQVAGEFAGRTTDEREFIAFLKGPKQQRAAR
jgi:thiol:disulfide interchange protein